jgi:hypothetical protein
LLNWATAVSVAHQDFGVGRDLNVLVTNRPRHGNTVTDRCLRLDPAPTQCLRALSANLFAAFPAPAPNGDPANNPDTKGVTMKSIRRRLAAATAVLTLIGTAACTGTKVSQQPLESANGPLESLFVTSFNTHLLSPAMCILDKGGVPPDLTADCHSEEHAAAIADYILSGSPYRDRYDVIALSEVWDEDAKDILVNALAGDGHATVGRYPFYVKKLDDDTVSVPSDLNIDKLINAEDSGLMLFSRFPFESLPKKSAVTFTSAENHFGSPWDDVEASANDAGKVAFIRFHECDAEDCLAGKGAGLVRIRKDGAMFTVVFTHLQADEGHDDTRSSQLYAIRYLLDHALDQDALQRDVFILGDLNIIGTSDEWPHNLNSIYPGWDAWWETSSKGDIGRTSNYGTGDRLDYHLYSKSTITAAVCPQHLKLDFYGLSDHLGVTGEYAQPAPRCSPSLAWANPPLDTPLLDDPAGNPSELRFKGSAQWFRVDRDGTFSFAVRTPQAGTKAWKDGGVDFEVYESTDLTHPVGPYKQMTSSLQTCQDPLAQNDCVAAQTTGTTFVLPKSPFYVKVFRKDGEPGIKYSLLIHRHACTDQNDACVLRPGADAEGPEWSTSAPINADDTAWFRVDTQSSITKQAQDLNFMMTNPSGQPATLALRDQNGTVLIDRTAPADASITGPDIAGKDAALLVGPNTFYVTIKRPLPVGGQFVTGLAARWTTNLTVLHGEIDGLGGTDDKGRPLTALIIKVVDETNGALGTEIGGDEVGLSFTTDTDNSTKTFPIWDHNMDEGEAAPLDAELPPIAFVDHITVRFCEVGGFLDDTGCNAQRINTLSPDDERAWSQKLEAEFDGGTWRLYYNVSHQLNT